MITLTASIQLSINWLCNSPSFKPPNRQCTKLDFNNSDFILHQSFTTLPRKVTWAKRLTSSTAHASLEKKLRRASYLENKTVLWLQMQIKNSVFDDLLKLGIPFTRHVECREEITNETHEYRKVVSDDLRDVEISQSTHQHLATASRQISFIADCKWSQRSYCRQHAPRVAEQLQLKITERCLLFQTADFTQYQHPQRSKP